MSDAKAIDVPVVFSGERLSNVSEDAAEAAAAYFQKWCREIQVIGYVRSPRSWATSAFQQNIKGAHQPVFNNLIKWPEYRYKFEKFDRIFGRENVSLIKFDRATLNGGDVVTDFCERIGATTIQPEDHIFENDTLSLEASALLYVKRKVGKPTWTMPRSGPARSALVAALKVVGTTKLVLSPALFEPLREANENDLRWMEARLGEDLGEPLTSTVTDTVGSEDALFEVAVRSAFMLDLIQEGLAPARPTVETVAAALDAFFDEQMAVASEALDQRRARSRPKSESPPAPRSGRSPRKPNDNSSRRISMTDMTHDQDQDNDEAEGAGPKKARSALARTLWKVSCKAEDRTFENAAVRKEAYQNEKKPFVLQANKVLRGLDKLGFELTEKSS